MRSVSTEADWPLENYAFQEYISVASAENERIDAGLPKRRRSHDANGPVTLETLCGDCGEQSWSAWRTGYCPTHYPHRYTGARAA